MAWRRTRTPEKTPARRSRHGRHGREGRSAVVRPPLPPLDTRVERFDLAVGTAVEFLRSAWPELREVRFEIADMPTAADADGIPRWSVLSDERRIVLYRLPIERLGHPHRDDDLHRRMIVEGAVFRAAAQYLDRDPWDLGHDRFH
ncbi:metallopeptidase family protein [Microbacterium aurantiacum]|uniref:Metallopeptidase family protein n=1 Tax=Microbacterium aurantiacum TaxID=162393 RepID=A0AAJ2HPF7_9MICO|nr:metallopeptidase family protein [Microbacterium aurantiacum]MDN4463548.1 metallopeptidase family protein [Microbacterium aurantiacum]MDS0246923.1 metallopeptidase family protein [Microbacterium aurantiacum]